MSRSKPSSRLMHLLTLLAMLFAFTAPALVSTEAMAVVKTKFRATKAQVAAGCAKGGGTPFDFGANYGCYKENCDGNNGVCMVDCEGGKCTGSTPGRILGEVTTLDQLLGNGVKFEDKIPAQPSVPQSLVESSPGSAFTPQEKPVRR